MRLILMIVASASAVAQTVIVAAGGGSETPGLFRSTVDLDVVHKVRGHNADFFIRSWTTGARIAYGFSPWRFPLSLAPSMVVTQTGVEPSGGLTLLLPKRMLVFTHHTRDHQMVGYEGLFGGNRWGVKVAADQHWLRGAGQFSGASCGVWFRVRRK